MAVGRVMAQFSAALSPQARKDKLALAIWGSLAAARDVCSSHSNLLNHRCYSCPEGQSHLYHPGILSALLVAPLICMILEIFRC